MTTAQHSEKTISLRSARRASLAGGVGTLIEYYDFSVYGFLTLTIGPLFFPSDNPTVSTLSALAVFASSYLIRPLGGWFFSRLGDRRGRRTALVATIVIMGAACGVMGLLPTYGQVGVAGTIAIVVVRLTQGFAAGGEIGGAATYIAELAPPGKRGFYGSTVSMGSTLGFAVAAGVVGLVRLLVPADQMATWGWRIPFLLSLVLTAVCLKARLRVEESPQFQELKEKAAIVRSPMLAALRSHPLSVARVAGLAIAFNGTGYFGVAYFAIFLQEEGFSATGVAWTSALCIALATFTYPWAGKLTDRYDRKPILLASYIIFAVIAWPVFALLIAATNLWAVGAVYLVFMFFTGWAQVPTWPLATELFPASVRYSGIAIGYNLGVIIGGITPLVAAALVAGTGSRTSPVYWILAVTLIGVITVARLPKTASKPLPA
ncbi:MFS transporter [Streptomyces sp. GMR22]|uniref:MFS transporter n=1 Tax=Streptomyces sp. GMR22 TaxID=2759524 RepID=UPI0015F96420|nr:MFS transporter [Streptomyces sp. GMR22]MBA6436766.1 MFS transporter [Streptomyces sp. GMR22]